MGTLVTEEVALIGIIDPDAYGVGAETTVWAPVENFHRIAALIMAGTLGAAATLDAKIQQATDAAGTGAKDVTGKAITQLVKATNDDDQAWIELNPAELDLANNFNHVQLSITVGAATSDAGACLFGYRPRYKPADDLELASVQEIVV